MDNPIVLVVGVVIALIAAAVVIGIVTHVIHFLFSLIIPVLLVIGAAYVLKEIFGRKSLGGSSRRNLL